MTRRAIATLAGIILAAFMVIAWALRRPLWGDSTDIERRVRALQRPPQSQPSLGNFATPQVRLALRLPWSRHQAAQGTHRVSR
jgi:hypothetical protein